MMTVSALIELGRKSLIHSDTALLDAQVLLCHVLGVDRSYLYKAPEEKVPDHVRQAYQKLVNQRQQGVPVSYLTGNKEFWSLDLKVDKYTLIPRPETELLVEIALEIIHQQSIRSIADLGTGTGAVALALASEIRKDFPDCSIIATDISPEALEIAKENMENLEINNLILKQGNWCKALDDTRLDLIVSNPPYIAENHSCLKEGDVRYEPMLALKSGSDGLNAIREIIHTAPEHLNPGGWLLLEHGHDQKQAIHELLGREDFHKVETRRDYAGLDRVTLAQVRQ